MDDTADKSALRPGNEWGWTGIDHQKKDDLPTSKTVMKGTSICMLESIVMVPMFLLLFSCLLLEGTVLVGTNKNLEVPTTFSKLLRWLGI